MKKGQCFERAYHILVNGSFKGKRPAVIIGKLRLVHGIVWHQETGYHIHGWLEDDVFCHDMINGKMYLITKDRYYTLGRIKTGTGEIFTYTREQAIKKALKVGYYYFSKLPCKI